MSLYNRIIIRQRPFWVQLLLGLLLLLAPAAAVSLDGMWEPVLRQGVWRPLLSPSVVIIYTLAVARWMSKNDAGLLEAFRSLVLVPREEFETLVQGASRLRPAGEVLAMLAGFVAGLAMSIFWIQSVETFWLRWYMPLAMALMDGLLAWTIYNVMADTRRMSALHRQPMRVDILDIRPFEPVGRHSLIVSLVFVGGIALGMVFGLDVKNILTWQAAVFYLPLMSVPVILFFLNMRGTHRLLATEKKRLLLAVSNRLRLAGAALRDRVDSGERLDDLAAEYASLAAFETRLRTAPTWPYNTGMLRTLFFTILVPLIVRGLSALIFGQ